MCITAAFSILQRGSLSLTWGVLECRGVDGTPPFRRQLRVKFPQN
jgi:hypothetical protein